MKKFLLIFFFCMAIAGTSKAQSVTSLTDPVVLAVDTDAVKLRLSIRLNQVQGTDTVYFLLGTTADNGDIYSAAVTLKKEHGSYFTSFGNNDYPVLGNKAWIEVIITPQQYQSLQFMTVYAINSEGGISPRKYKNL